MASIAPDAPPKKRKLKQPRTSQACIFCKKRKVRCSGTFPCEVCTREEVPCHYAGGIHAKALSTDSNAHKTPRTINESAPIVSHRSSTESLQTFTPGNHVGATSGVSFLYGQWDNREEGDIVDVNIRDAPLVSWGDLPRPNAATQLAQPRFTNEQMTHILDRYFTSISPTYRFLHHPTVKSWGLSLISNSRLPAAPKACVLLVCAQTLLHDPFASGYHKIGLGDREFGTNCFEVAKALLDTEPGPPSLVSIQARIGLCLYLLSTFRLNECRYCFSFAVTIATTLGIHRKESSMAKRVDTLESESCRRAFWSLYILDGYLSVMLGRPRLLRDDDIDQPFPNNIADDDLTAQELIEDLPRHGNLEAFLSHAKLAQLMASGNDQLYPLHSLSNDQLLQRSNDMLDHLEKWQVELPTFLRAKQKTFTGQQTFARQNTILKLAWSHVRILMTRRCLLIEPRLAIHSHDSSLERSIRECIAAIRMVLDTVDTLIQQGQCYGSFWSTQYIALVAISTLYVSVIQGVSHDDFRLIEDCLEMARRCHDYLATLPPSGSQAERHQVLLSRLRAKAERSLSRHKTLINPEQSISTGNAARNDDYLVQVQENSGKGWSMMSGTSFMPQEQYASSRGPLSGQDIVTMDRDVQNDMSALGSNLTPNPSADNDFFSMLDFGWERLDIIGASSRPNFFDGLGD